MLCANSSCIVITLQKACILGDATRRGRAQGVERGFFLSHEGLLTCCDNHLEVFELSPLAQVGHGSVNSGDTFFGENFEGGSGMR